MKVLAGIIGGFLMAVIGALLIAVGGASRSGSGAMYGAVAFFVLWIVGVVIAVSAKSASKAWRRLFISTGLLSFCLPLSAIFFTGSHVASAIEKGGDMATASIAGAAIGGGIVSGFMGILGFFLGAVFLIIGLLVGRDKPGTNVDQ